MTTLAIIGPGAIGGSIAAWLSRNPSHEILLCSRNRLKTIHFTHPDGHFDANFKNASELSQATPVDWIIFCTKTYDVEKASQWLKPLSHDKTRLAVLQNGVEHQERLAPFFPREAIVPVVVDLPAERNDAAHISQRGHGLMTVPDDQNGRAFASLFENTPLELNLTDDFITVAWNKLCLNSAGVMSALTLQPAGIMHQPEIADAARQVVNECAAVGRALGAKLPEDIADWVIERYQQAPKDSVNSLHGDRLAGKKGEVDARHGVIVRKGKILGIPTPTNQLAYALLSETSARK